MIKRFIKNFIFFWKESFSFMQGYNKLYIFWGCLKGVIPFCVDMEKWHRIKDKQTAYANMDRFI
jgi:hypothetical protein